MPRQQSCCEVLHARPLQGFIEGRRHICVLLSHLCDPAQMQLRAEQESVYSECERSKRSIGGLCVQQVQQAEAQKRSEDILLLAAYRCADRLEHVKQLVSQSVSMPGSQACTWCAQTKAKILLYPKNEHWKLTRPPGAG